MQIKHFIKDMFQYFEPAIKNLLWSSYWAKFSVTLQHTVISVQALSNRLRKLLSNNITQE